MNTEDRIEEIKKAYGDLAKKLGSMVEPEDHPVTGKSLDLMKLPWFREV